MHEAFLAEVEIPDDSLDIPQHGVTVNKAEYEAWLRSGHDPGDEDDNRAD